MPLPLLNALATHQEKLKSLHINVVTPMKFQNERSQLKNKLVQRKARQESNRFDSGNKGTSQLEKRFEANNRIIKNSVKKIKQAQVIFEVMLLTRT